MYIRNVYQNMSIYMSLVLLFSHRAHCVHVLFFVSYETEDFFFLNSVYLTFQLTRIVATFFSVFRIYFTLHSHSTMLHRMPLENVTLMCEFVIVSSSTISQHPEIQSKEFKCHGADIRHVLSDGNCFITSVMARILLNIRFENIKEENEKKNTIQSFLDSLHFVVYQDPFT